MHWAALLAILPLVAAAPAPAPVVERDVDTRYPYKGPAIPIGDLSDQTIAGDGTGKAYRRLRMPPAVTPPPGVKVTNNINVISTALFPGGVNIHFQTPFGLGTDPFVRWGENPYNLKRVSKGYSHTYDRTPPCSLDEPTQCSQFFHEVRLENLKPGTTYYYEIPGGNGTAPSDVLSVTTAPKKGDESEFSIAVLADMGYTNAKGTHEKLVDAVQDNVKFVWHGGDLSYADQWYAPILPCVLTGPHAWGLCYNASDSTIPGGSIDNDDYYIPIPEGEAPSQGGAFGGDISTMYEKNWDLWQQWQNAVTKHVPYMVASGNHETTCAEFDGPNNELSAMMENNQTAGSHAENSTASYYSCPPSQRNFTAYQHRFNMPGEEVGGRSNFWYSFDYGQAHFITLSGETDYYQSPNTPFIAELKGNETHPTREETFLTDSGPFGDIDGGNFKDNKAYEQYQWLEKDLAGIDRKKTPWVFAMSHRPMYSSKYSSSQDKIRTAFEDLMLKYNVDVYYSGHIHWYERLFPMSRNGTVDMGSVVNNHTYTLKQGTMTHIINGAAGNVESHATLAANTQVKPLTAVLDGHTYGFMKMTIYNATACLWEFVSGKDGSTADYVYLLKEGSKKKHSWW